MSSLIVMGVAGCGKSSLGRVLADALGWPLVEGDDFHPPANLAKMAAGIPLTDLDRADWLDALGAQLGRERGGLVLTCSALKRSYRDRLRAASPGLRFVHLRIDQQTALCRVAARAGEHLFPPSLVESQFAALEPPTGEPGVIEIDATEPLPQLMARVTAWMQGEKP